MRELFSPLTKFGLWRRLWLALMRAERDLGAAIPSEAIAELEAHLEPVGDVLGDARALQQMVINLLDNAVKYSGESRRVEVTVSSRDGRVELSVTDHGIGIPKEHQERIFSEFFRSYFKLHSSMSHWPGMYSIRVKTAGESLKFSTVVLMISSVSRAPAFVTTPIIEPVGNANGKQTFLGNNISFFNQDPTVSKQLRYQIGAQHELAGGWVAEAENSWAQGAFR